MNYTLSSKHADTEVPAELHAQLEEAWATLCGWLKGSKREADKKHLGPSGVKNSPQPPGSTWFAVYHNEALLGGRRIGALLDGLTQWGFTVERMADGWTVTKGSECLGYVLTIALEPMDVTKPRPIFTPAVHPRKAEKQYVKDDLGNLTRRFAYCVREGEAEVGGAARRRPKNKVEAIAKGDNFIRGAPSNTDRTQAATLAASVEGRGEWCNENADTKLYLAYMNYAGNGKLGYCLASSPIRVRDNAGKAFANTVGHSLWIIDLARIPNTSVLVNIYAQYPALDLTVRTRRQTYNMAEAHRWISEGTAKNRESFCSDLPYEAIVAELALTKEMIEGGHCWKSEARIEAALGHWV